MIFCQRGGRGFSVMTVLAGALSFLTVLSLWTSMVRVNVVMTSSPSEDHVISLSLQFPMLGGGNGSGGSGGGNSQGEPRQPSSFSQPSGKLISATATGTETRAAKIPSSVLSIPASVCLTAASPAASDGLQQQLQQQQQEAAQVLSLLDLQEATRIVQAVVRQLQQSGMRVSFPRLGHALYQAAVQQNKMLLTVQAGGMDGKSNDPMYKMFVQQGRRRRRRQQQRVALSTNDKDRRLLNWLPVVMEPVQANFEKLTSTYNDIQRDLSLPCPLLAKYAVQYSENNNNNNDSDSSKENASTCSFCHFDTQSTDPKCLRQQGWVKEQLGSLDCPYLKARPWGYCIVEDKVPCGPVISFVQKKLQLHGQPPPIGLLQVDIEGFEQILFNGLLKEISNDDHLPPVIHFESKVIQRRYNPNANISVYEEVHRDLVARGYVLFPDGEDTLAIRLPKAQSADSAASVSSLSSSSSVVTAAATTTTTTTRAIEANSTACTYASSAVSLLDLAEAHQVVRNMYLDITSNKKRIRFSTVGRNLYRHAAASKRLLLTVEIGAMDGMLGGNPMYKTFVERVTLLDPKKKQQQLHYWLPIVLEPAPRNFLALKRNYQTWVERHGVSCPVLARFAADYSSSSSSFASNGTITDTTTTTTTMIQSPPSATAAAAGETRTCSFCHFDWDSSDPGCQSRPRWMKDSIASLDCEHSGTTCIVKDSVPCGSILQFVKRQLFQDAVSTTTTTTASSTVTTNWTAFPPISILQIDIGDGEGRMEQSVLNGFLAEIPHNDLLPPVIHFGSQRMERLQSNEEGSSSSSSVFDQIKRDLGQRGYVFLVSNKKEILALRAA